MNLWRALLRVFVQILAGLVLVYLFRYGHFAYWELVPFFLIPIGVGLAVDVFVPDGKADGTLFMYDVDENTVGWHLNLDSPLDELPKKSSIRLNISDKTTK